MLRALAIDEPPHGDEYETLAGFLMVMPRRTDSVTWAGYKFEVMDVDSYRIDQVLVTRGAGVGEAAEWAIRFGQVHRCLPAVDQSSFSSYK